MRKCIVLSHSIRQSARYFSGHAWVPYLPFVRLFVGECDGYCPVFELDFISLDSRAVAGVRGR
jgi:hypothetical protein